MNEMIFGSIFFILGLVFLFFNKPLAAYQMWRVETFWRWFILKKKGVSYLKKSKFLMIFFRIVNVIIGLILIISMSYMIYGSLKK